MPTIITINCPVSTVYTGDVCLLKENVDMHQDLLDVTAHILKKVSLKFGNTRYDQTTLQISFFLIAARYISCLRSNEFWYEASFSKLLNLANDGLRELELPLVNLCQGLDYPIDSICVQEFSNLKDACRMYFQNEFYALIIDPVTDWGAICNANHRRLQFFNQF